MASKRGNGEGSIYERAPGQWRAALTLDSGKRKVLCGRTRQEVAQKLSAALVARGQGLPVTVERQTLGCFLERWLEEAAKPTLRLRTFESYAMIVRRHLVPALGRRQLAQLTPQDVQGYMNAKRATGLSARTVLYHRAVLRRALGKALKWGMVARNVATLVDPPRTARS